MWKPGTSHPSLGKNSNKKTKKQINVKEEPSPLAGSGSILTMTTPTSTTTPKRLSGATMNMRFMKRKQETKEQEQQRKRILLENGRQVAASTRVVPSMEVIPSPSSSSGVLSSPTVHTPLTTQKILDSNHRKGDDNGNDDGEDDDMDIDDPTPTITTTKIQPQQSQTPMYQVATPIDMYGIQGTLLGRRSFGGFNAAIEDAWKESKASFEMDASLDRKRTHGKQTVETEEELIQRYQELVEKRSSASSRPVGNLQDKMRRPRR